MLTVTAATTRNGRTNFFAFPIGKVNAAPPVRLAVLLMVSHYYENRDNPDRTIYVTMRMAFENLLYPYRDLDKFF